MAGLLAAGLGSAAEFTGAASCGECHPKQYQSQSTTHHARALRPIQDTPLADLLTREPLRERSGVIFQYRRAPGGVEVSVVKGSASVRMLLEWCFGAGSQGYTPVGRVGAEYVEHRVSWYRESGRLGLTAGHPESAPLDLDSALGIPQSPQMISRCFGCHATGVEGGPDLTRMRPGVTCERCHGPGGDHVARARGGKALANTILNPRRQPLRAQIEVCSQCHRSPNAQFASTMPELDDPVSIRFAPVGFQASACFRQSKTFSCVACHDPHRDPRPAADPFYTSVCLQCHAEAPRVASTCPRALKANCVQCHMKAASPLPHLKFTDHRIRIYLE